MKHIGLAVVAYENDSGYIVPSSKTSDGVLNLAAPLWYETLRQNKCLNYEEKKAAVLRCPSHLVNGNAVTNSVSYSGNIFVMGMTQSQTLGPPWDELWKVRKAASLHSPASLVLMGERGSDYPIGSLYSPVGVRVVFWSGKNPSTPWGFDWSRHAKKITFSRDKKKMYGAKANLLLADGHAESFSGEGWDIVFGSNIWGGVIGDPPPGYPSMSISGSR